MLLDLTQHLLFGGRLPLHIEALLLIIDRAAYILLNALGSIVAFFFLKKNKFLILPFSLSYLVRCYNRGISVKVGLLQKIIFFKVL